MDEDFRRRLEAYPLATPIALRYGDVDRQGHLNNVAIAALYQEARVALLERIFGPLTADSRIMVVEQTLRFLGEGHVVETIAGSGVARIGRSSYGLAHGLFQGDRCIGLCDTVVVNVGEDGKPAALLEPIRAAMEGLMLRA